MALPTYHKRMMGIGLIAMLLVQAGTPGDAAGKKCGQDDGSGEVVVCASNDAARYRLKPLDSARFEPNRRAEISLLGDVKAAAEVESKAMLPGMTSNRLMVRLKVPF